jgi:hypothetical protein
MCKLGLFLAAFMAAAGIASAQIAAPSLNPTPTMSLQPLQTPSPFIKFLPTPVNPAVLPWDGPSRIGVTYGTAKVDSLLPVDPALKGKASGVLAEAVGETFAAAIQLNTMTQDYDPAIVTGTFETKVQRIGLAAQFGKRISVGLGRETVGTTDTSFPTAIDQEDTLTTGGITVRLGEMFYLGAASGSETIKDKQLGQEVKRNALQYGLAFLARDKERGAHIEIYHAQRPARLFPNAAPAAAENSVNGVTVEFMVARILLGYATQKDKTKDDVGVPLEINSVTTVTLGYDMAPGLALVVSRYGGENQNAGSGVVNFKNRGLNAGAAWQF